MTWPALPPPLNLRPYGGIEMCIIIIIVITHADGSHVGMVFSGVYVFCMFVCLFVFQTISQKSMQLGSPNLT